MDPKSPPHLIVEECTVLLWLTLSAYDSAREENWRNRVITYLIWIFACHADMELNSIQHQVHHRYGL
ncbi:hypothetical protein CY34DRAFT_803636 [Suillus luteus UH-Slu-Lm8-n1]|uniref:Uncharacterized protein n=1 Tax=Suillus luteus UH-Slu-Lm8-n1 TaxID=930992 RepID=A0A0D0BK62_9AGAM|nr:hypothetical protein CY34DRAFT_803636 [Suillus luteus UH-Slu-Lm8-n1]